ncbi:MAG: ACT domain-containing protein [Desulfobacterales bacterium]|nr:MAG: ACT domain-containing protein [Desulfobacterales bacterium]
MTKTMRLKQLSFILPDKIGLLAEVTAFITAAKINIEAICAYGMGDEGYFMMITDNNAKAKKLISNMGAEVKTEDVIAVEVPNKVGQLQQAARKISDAGIDIAYVYGSPVKQKMTLIFKTANDKKAIRALDK